MKNSQTCPIYGTPAKITPGNGGYWVVDSPESGGKYRLTRRADILLSNTDERIRGRVLESIREWIQEQRSKGKVSPKITGYTVDDIRKRFISS